MAPRKIERKDTQFERQMTYGKRSKGLLKKAFELSVLCDVDVALIMYAPNGRLRHFSNKKLERILQEYIQHQATISETNAGEVDNSVKRPAISQDTIEKINRFVGQVDMADQQGLEANKEEINEETKKLTMLQELQKKLIPNMGTSRSIHELEERKRFLVEALHKIEQKKTTILSRFNIGISPHFSQPNLLLQTGEQLQQEYQKEIETPFIAQPQDMQQFNVPPLLPEPFEISKDPWSLDDIANHNMSQEMPESFEISKDPWSLDDIVNQNMSQIMPESFEISKDPWSLDDIANHNMSQEMPESFEISKDPWSLDDIVNQNMSQIMPESFEISKDPWSLDDIVNQNMSQEMPESFEISKDPWSLDDIVNQNMSQEELVPGLPSDYFEDLDWVLQTN